MVILPWKQAKSYNKCIYFMRPNVRMRNILPTMTREPIRLKNGRKDQSEISLTRKLKGFNK